MSEMLENNMINKKILIRFYVKSNTNVRNASKWKGWLKIFVKFRENTYLSHLTIHRKKTPALNR